MTKGVPLAGLKRRARVYLVAPSTGEQCIRVATHGPTFDALVELGYDVVVTAAVHENTGCVDDLLAAVDLDLDTLRHSDYVVVAPGGEHLLETLLAPALGLPVLHLADFAELIAA